MCGMMCSLYVFWLAMWGRGKNITPSYELRRSHWEWGAEGAMVETTIPHLIIFHSIQNCWPHRKGGLSLRDGYVEPAFHNHWSTAKFSWWRYTPAWEMLPFHRNILPIRGSLPLVKHWSKTITNKTMAFGEVYGWKLAMHPKFSWFKVLPRMCNRKDLVLFSQWNGSFENFSDALEIFSRYYWGWGWVGEYRNACAYP